MKSRWVTEGPEVIESRSTGHIGTGEAGRNNRLHRTVREVRWNSSTFVAVRFRWGDATPMANATEGLIREVSFRCSLLALLSPLLSSLSLLSLSLSPSISLFIAFNRFRHLAAARSRSLASRGGLAQGSSAGNERGAIWRTGQEDIWRLHTIGSGGFCSGNGSSIARPFHSILRCFYPLRLPFPISLGSF